MELHQRALIYFLGSHDPRRSYLSPAQGPSREYSLFFFLSTAPPSKPPVHNSPSSQLPVIFFLQLPRLQSPVSVYSRAFHSLTASAYISLCQHIFKLQHIQTTLTLLLEQHPVAMNRGRVKRSSVPLQRGPPSIFIFLSVYTLPRPGDTLAVPTQYLWPHSQQQAFIRSHIFGPTTTARVQRHPTANEPSINRTHSQPLSCATLFLTLSLHDLFLSFTI